MLFAKIEQLLNRIIKTNDYFQAERFWFKLIRFIGELVDTVSHK